MLKKVKKAEEYSKEHSQSGSVSNTNTAESKKLLTDIRKKYKNATPQQKQDAKSVLINHNIHKLELTTPISVLKEMLNKFE